MTKTVDLSIVIVNWNTSELLAQCLESLGNEQQAMGREQDATNSPTMEVIVVDNASTDGSTAMVRLRFPWVTLIESPDNLGFAAGNNLALSQARGNLFLLLNPDTRMKPQAITCLLNAMADTSTVGVVGAQLLNLDGSQQSSWGVFPNLSTELPVLSQFGCRRRYQRAVGAAEKSRTPVLVDWVSGACLMIRRQVAEEIGYLDETYWLYTEETDWCYRAYQAGWQVALAPTAQVYHVARSASRQRYVSTMLYFYQSRVRFIRKHRGDTYGAMVKNIYRRKAWYWQVRPAGSPLAHAYPDLPFADIRQAYKQLQRAMSLSLDLLLSSKWS